MTLEEKLYRAIFDFLIESHDKDKADEQSTLIVENIMVLLNEVSDIIDLDNDMDYILLSQKYHTIKNLLLYGDFYYESDICQDIEEMLRTTHTVGSIKSLHKTLLDSLKM